MIAILIAGTIAFMVGLAGTPVVIGYFRQRGFGQPIRDEGPESHQSKAGTPTMGGISIVVGAVLAFAIAHLGSARLTTTGLLVLATFVVMAMVGLADDLIKLRMRRNLGLNKATKFIGQAVIAGLFAFLGPTIGGIPQNISLVGDLAVDVPRWVFFIWIFLLLTGFSNAVNLTDGLDGLAAGVTISATLCFLVVAYLAGRADLSGYLIIHHVQGAGELTVLLAALIGGCFGFLWFNGYPADVFMGDTGSMMIGGLLGTVALLIKQEFLLLIVGGVFVAEALSVIIQVGSYKLRKKRVFLMSPLHHHFERAGVPESRIIVRFWIMSALLALAGLATLKIR